LEAARSCYKILLDVKQEKIASREYKTSEVIEREQTMREIYL
jgi:hypothetical protein